MLEYRRRVPTNTHGRSLAAATVCVFAAIGTACSASSTSPATTVPTQAAQAAVANGAAPSRTDAHGVEWLCRPGLSDNPCSADLTSTVVPESGPTSVEHASPAANPAVDCFYVYPTVSEQSGAVANLHIDPSEMAVARIQASRFSEVCKVYAPIYPQLTLHALADPGAITGSDLVAAYASVQTAWEDYLAHYNRGRGFILIGHSQGASMLIKLLQKQVDNNPAVRSHLVSAIILGGNVTVPVGGTVGGSFQHIPACTTSTQTGCVIAYSSFDADAPTQLSLRPAGFRSQSAVRQYIEGWVAGPVRQSSQPLRWDRPPDPLLPDQVVGQRSWWTVRSRASCTSHTVGNRAGSLFGSVPLTGRGDVVASDRPYPCRAIHGRSWGRHLAPRGASTWSTSISHSAT